MKMRKFLHVHVETYLGFASIGNSFQLKRKIMRNNGPSVFEEARGGLSGGGVLARTQNSSPHIR